MISILQINVGVGRAAQDLALATMARAGADLLILSEQNRSCPESDGWYPDASGRSAIVTKGTIPLNQIGDPENGFRWLEFPGVRVYSCYWSPNCNITEYKDFLLRLERSIRASTMPIIAAGDFNAKSHLWGSPSEDARGKALADTMAALDMQACNVGNHPTFERGTSRSHIDVTFSSGNIRNKINNWRVLDIESLSLHRYISFSLSLTPSPIAVQQSQKGWSTRRIDAGLLSTALKTQLRSRQNQPLDAETEATSLIEWISSAADSCLPKRRIGNGKQAAPWWSMEISTLRCRCLKARRIHQRQRKRLGEQNARVFENQWKEARKTLALAIKVAKEKCWSDMIRTIDSDVWGKPYKIVMKRLTKHSPATGIELPGRIENIVNALFPTRPARRNITEPIPDAPTLDLLVSEGEIIEAAISLPNHKAPGPDNIPNEIIKVAVATDPKRFQQLFNKCLTEKRFPSPWKSGKLVLIPKLGKPPDSPSAYRPICLMDGCGKLLEKLLVAKMRDHLVNENAISDNQFGFRRGKSTLDALTRLKTITQAATEGHVIHHKLVGLLTLDVRNAFNSAPWEAILEAARDKQLPPGLIGMLDAYLSDRTVQVSSPSGITHYTKEMTCGVPQGSVLGPDLWILLYDSLLRLEMPEGVHLLAFADDVAVVSVHKIPFVIEERLEEAFNTIEGWMSEHGLQLAAEKSEALVITNKRVRNEISVHCAGHTIESKKSLRYLGVQIDKKLRFQEHAELVAERAAKSARQLGYLMPNTGGPRQKSRRLLSCVTTSRLLYAAPFWADKMGAGGWSKMASVHRRSQLRTACCYRTVSHEAAAVVSGIPPIKLLARERLEIYQGLDKQSARRNLIAKWQEEWANDLANGRWTFKLIGQLDKWLSRSHGDVTFHITQVLTGHGCFGSYLHRFHLQDTDICAQCGHTPDDVEHGVFKCDAWENWRRQACGEIGVPEIRPDNLIGLMLSSPTRWKIIGSLITRIMMTREKDERARQHQPR